VQVLKTRQTQHLVLVVGLGLAAVFGLLWWMNRYAPAVQASANLPVMASTAGMGSISASWTTTTPDSTVLDDESQTWTITLHHVVITFAANSIGENSIAVFTFTPQTSPTVPLVLPSSHFYDLSGVYSGTTIRVSLLTDYDLALQYNPSELGGAKENTLRFYYYDPLKGWTAETTTVDADKDTAYCTTRRTGQFALAGYSDQLFLPIVLRNY
jgi:hypothetical protein